MVNMPDQMPDRQAPTELGRFLRARREGIRPQDAGLPSGSGSRRTPGLRREEIATLAGVSIDYYTRLERGRETRPSPAGVDALARAPRRPPPPPRPPTPTVRPSVRLLLETLRPHPAFVVNRTSDVLAANPSGV